jgi:hypothetical protein
MVSGYWLHFNRPLEGRVEYMYLDVKGYVSTGVGNKIDQTAGDLRAPTPEERASSLVEANRLGWQVKQTEAPATPDQIAADWDTVKSRLDLAPSGHRPFKDLTVLFVSDEEIDRFVMVKVGDMEANLTRRTEFTDFTTWPANAQLATLSMCWALGENFRFPKFQAHVANHDWASAAEECHFNPDEGTIRIRNKLDRMHFLIAAAVAGQGLATEPLAASLQDVLGVQHALYMMGYNPGPQDGVDGPTTQQTVKDFQANSGVVESGVWSDPDTQAAMRDALTSIGWVVV